MQAISTFRYLGSKKKFLFQFYKLINPILNDKSNFIEPFCGSAVISINLSPLFEKTIISDIDKNILDIHHTFKNIPYSEYEAFSMKYKPYIGDSQYGERLCNKETYYEFKKLINEETNKTYKIFGNYMCIGACLNGLVRFGPNGFNQSCGNRDLSQRFNYFSYTKFQSHYKNIIIEELPYIECLNKHTNENSILFLDPPYFGTGGVYMDNFNDLKKKEFMDTVLKYQDLPIIYTDVYNKETLMQLNGNNNKFRCIKLRNMRQVGPYQNTEMDIEEVIYTNIR